MDPHDYSERFYSIVNTNGPIPEHHPELGPCQIWTGCINQNGYGQFHRNDKEPAHRVAFELTNEPIPEGLMVDNICHVRIEGNKLA